MTFYVPAEIISEQREHQNKHGNKAEDKTALKRKIKRTTNTENNAAIKQKRNTENKHRKQTRKTNTENKHGKQTQKTIRRQDRGQTAAGESEKGPENMRLRNIPTARQELAQSPYVINETAIYQLRGRWAELFQNDRPIHIEIGMGKGQFLLELARRNPEVNYVGIERYSSVLVHPVRKLEAQSRPAQPDNAARMSVGKTDAQSRPTQPDNAAGRFSGKPEAQPEYAQSRDETAHIQREEPLTGEDSSITNIYLLRMDAERLTDVFAPGEVDRIYLNFSDPWPKDRHAKRRLPGRVFLGRYAQVLSPGGRVEFKTDNRSLFDFAIEESEEAGWKIDACTYDLHHDSALNEGNIMTEYEARFSSQGNPICKLIEHPATSES